MGRRRDGRVDTARHAKTPEVRKIVTGLETVAWLVNDGVHCRQDKCE
ncbi:hypothetical protein BN2497_1775 [Janthinobacterium sp. CG23_2]|nr:hypothetical protein BN2497_1775 [Janthinobacterium sp. CG23_2]CUU27285.1 hypothetical protein BN3177_1775 [Janthinobacterium sp. CG23_2]